MEKKLHFFIESSKSHHIVLSMLILQSV